MLVIIQKIHNTIDPRLTTSNRPKTTILAIFCVYKHISYIHDASTKLGIITLGTIKLNMFNA